MANRDPFYIGYLDRIPEGIAGRTRFAVAMLVSLGIALGLLLTFGQSPFDEGAFEFGVDREFDGIVVEKPYPMLLAPGTDGAAPTTYYLVAFGKTGATEFTEGFDGQAAQVTGSLIFNEQQSMIEVHAIEKIESDAGSLTELGPEVEIPLGRMTLKGEVVDSKCHLGVMKPGRGKPHKACAIRCISGGIPPVLRVTNHAGEAEYLLLVDTDGSPVNRDVLEFVAEPVEISGEVVRAGARLILYADPTTYRLVGR
jgi:hypothetical protein